MKFSRAQLDAVTKYMVLKWMETHRKSAKQAVTFINSCVKWVNNCDWPESGSFASLWLLMDQKKANIRFVGVCARRLSKK